MAMVVQWKAISGPDAQAAQYSWSGLPAGPGLSFDVEARSDSGEVTEGSVQGCSMMTATSVGGSRSSEQRLRQKRDLLRQRLEARPDDSRVLARLAQIQVELDEVDDFVVFARDFCACHPCAWRASVRVLSQHLGRSLDAAAVLREVHRENPRDAEVCCALARVEPARARSWYEKAYRANPHCVDALLAIADDHRKCGRFGVAARLYETAHRQSPLAMRALYRLGETLVKDSRHAEGRNFLMQVLLDGNSTYGLHASVMVALSHVMCQQHESALEACRRAEEVHRACAQRSWHYLKLARILKGITQLRSGDTSQAIQTLRSAALCAGDADIEQGDSSLAAQHWDVLIESTLGLAETLRGGHVAAEIHLEKARRLDGPLRTDSLVNFAYLRQAQGDLDAAQRLLDECLAVDRDSPMALLRVGYLHLCRHELSAAVQFLQKCLQQPSGTLAYGSAEKGTAHLYLCVAYYWLDAEHPPAHHGRMRQLAEDQFWSGYKLQPDLPRALADLRDVPGNIHPVRSAGSAVVRLSSSGAPPPNPPLPGARLVSGSPPRMGQVDLTPEQAGVILAFAEHCSLVPVSVLRSPQPEIALDTAISKPTIIPSPNTRPLLTTTAAFFDEWKTGGKIPVGAVGLGVSTSPAILGGADPTLVGTASTAAPTSAGPSRNASDPALVPVGGCDAMLGGFRSDEVQAPVPGTYAETAASAAAAVAVAAPLPSVELRPGKLLRFDDLELGECISHGEFTVVHRGELLWGGGSGVGESRVGAKRSIVVKSLHQKDCVHDEQAAAELRAEIAIIAELSHPRIVTFVGACLEPDNVALVTDLAPGGNLHQALHVHRRRFARGERFTLAMELLEGVEYLHAQSPPIAHLDLKSMNLVLDAEGHHLQLCDFGLARALGGNLPPCGDRPPSRGGSPRYMAPECYDSAIGHITEKADSWSSGCVLIEIFGESLPYAECSNVQQILKLMLVQHQPPSLPAPIEAPVRGVIACALAFDARERPNAAEMLSRLRSIAGAAAAAAGTAAAAAAATAGAGVGAGIAVGGPGEGGKLRLMWIP